MVEKKRCAWANPKNELYLKYHDEEWGVEVHDDKIHFEFLILEGAQAGLSWETVLKKRENYRKAYDGFDVKKVAKYSESKIQELILDAGIIRNKLKIRSSVKNAQIFLDIQKEFGSFNTYLWGFVGGKQIVNTFKSIEQLQSNEVAGTPEDKNLLRVPASTKESDALSKDLKKRGMNFVGSTIMYAFMQAVGLVDDHEENCFIRTSKK